MGKDSHRRDIHRRRARRGPLSAIVSHTRNFGRNERGGTLVYVALMMPVLLGMGGLAIDVGMWYADRRNVQNFVDAAAFAAVLEMRRSDGDATAVEDAAEEAAGHSGYNPPGDSLAVYWPPQSGPFAGDNDYVEVIGDSSAQSWLGTVISERAFTVEARAVAKSQIVEACVFALNTTERSSIKVNGSATVNLGCGVFVNSSDSEALTVDGGGSCATPMLSAPVIGVVGSYTQPDSCYSTVPNDSLNQITDPLSHIDGPAYGGCDDTTNHNLGNGDVLNLSPGVYCGNINIQGAGTLNLVPNGDDDNVFVFDNMSLTIGSNGTMNGDGVFMYFTENQNNSSEDWDIGGGATVDLSAAETGPWATYIFYHDRNAGDAVDHSLTGGANQTIDGIIYAPTMDLQYAGNSTLSGGTSMMVADEITFSGDTNIGGFEGSIIVNNNDLYGARLVE